MLNVIHILSTVPRAAALATTIIYSFTVVQGCLLYTSDAADE